MKLLPPATLMTIHAYLDGELALAERQTFEENLAADPLLAAALTAEQEFRMAIRTRARQVQASPSLRAGIQAALAAAAPSPSPSRWQRFQAWWSTPQPIRPVVGLLYTLLWLVALGGIFWGLAPLPGTGSFVQLANRHAIYFENEPLLDVTGSPAEITGWFRDRHLPFPVTAPPLAGWELAGARLGEVNQQSAAHLLYRRPDGRRLSLTFFTPDADDFPAQAEVNHNGQSFFVGDNGQHTAIAWRNNGLGYALIADIDLPTETLLNLAGSLRQQLH